MLFRSVAYLDMRVKISLYCVAYLDMRVKISKYCVVYLDMRVKISLYCVAYLDMRVEISHEDMFPLSRTDVVVKVTYEEINCPWKLFTVEVHRQR